MTRMVKRLTDLEIDEVSLVTRPANQHGLVAIAKSHMEEDSMGVYDANGDEVFEHELEIGVPVFGEDGTQFDVVEDLGDEGEGEEEFGKARMPMHPSVIPTDTSFGARAKRGADSARRHGKKLGEEAKTRGGNAYGQARSTEAGQHVMRNSGKYKAAAGFAAGGAAAQVGKSLGTQVLEELSKALTDNDRDQVFAKAADRFDEIAERNGQLEELVMGLYNDRDAEGYAQLAKGYELPIDPDEIGAIMHRASQVLPQEDLATLDRVFSSVGAISKANFEEIGYGGGVHSDTLAQVYAMAGEAVGKSDSGMSQEQAVVALFAANPDAYDAAENEQRRF